MKLIRVVLIIMIIVNALSFAFAIKRMAERKERVTIVKATTDSRGLISVVYVQDSDTLALDYLTVKELDSLISVGR